MVVRDYGKCEVVVRILEKCGEGWKHGKLMIGEFVRYRRGISLYFIDQHLPIDYMYSTNPLLIAHSMIRL